MGPIIHIGLIAAFLVLAELSGHSLSLEICFAVFMGGVFIDGDKVFEIIDNKLKRKKGKLPDITAPSRILHSGLAFPYGLVLSLMVFSWLPFVAVLIHIFLDSIVPGVIKDGKHYPSHSLWKWVTAPFLGTWKIVTIGWPVTYPPEFNWVYKRLAPLIGIVLILLSALYWLFFRGTCLCALLFLISTLDNRVIIYRMKLYDYHRSSRKIT